MPEMPFAPIADHLLARDEDGILLIASRARDRPDRVSRPPGE